MPLLLFFVVLELKDNSEEIYTLEYKNKAGDDDCHPSVVTTPPIRNTATNVTKRYHPVQKMSRQWALKKAMMSCYEII